VLAVVDEIESILESGVHEEYAKNAGGVT